MKFHLYKKLSIRFKDYWELFRFHRVQRFNVDFIANNVDLLLCANLFCSSKSHPSSGYPARSAEWNFTVEPVAIQKDSVHCFVGFCCTDDLLSSVWLGFAGSNNVVGNNSTYIDHLLFCAYTGLFKLLPEPLAVLLENQRSETCSKGNILRKLDFSKLFRD